MNDEKLKEFMLHPWRDADYRPLPVFQQEKAIDVYDRYFKLVMYKISVRVQDNLR